jgi:hypothetical protein
VLQVAPKAQNPTIFGIPCHLVCFPNYPFQSSRYQVDEDGIGNTDFTIDAILKKHIPETLPICGKRIKVSYPGIPALCSRCWRIGHAQFECKQPHKTNWLELVADFYGDEHHVTEEMLGTWTDALYKYHPSLASDPVAKNRTRLFVSQEKTKDLRSKLPKANDDAEDLRQQLKRTKELLQHQELLLQRAGNPRNQRQDATRDVRPQQRQHQQREDREREGARRGRGRGRQGPSRGHGLFRGDPRLKN